MRIAPKVVAAAAAAALWGAASGARAGGFAVLAQSASTTGNAYTGAAAAEDASTIWHNPAGMVRLPGAQISLNANAISTSFKYRDGGSTGAFAAPGTGEGGDGGDLALVPQLYASTSMGEGWWAGIAVNTPFGLKTEYQPGWRGQLTALKSEAQSVNINPAVARELGRGWSLGAGIDLQRLRTELTSFAGPAGNAKLEASDTGWGYNLGAMYRASESTRVGLAYRSQIAYKLSGNATFSASSALDSGARSDITVPENVSLTAFSAVSPEWEIVAAATWTRWSRVQSFDVVRTSATAAGQPQGSTVTTLQFKWRNTTLLGAGANYRLNDEWKLRAGVAYDPAVSNDETRTARLPDQSRLILALGARYAASKNGSLDLAYAHDFVRTANINNTVAGVPGALTGSFKSSVDVLSVQYNHRF